MESYSCSDDEGARCRGPRWWCFTSAAHVSAVNLSLPALQIPPPASSAVSCNTTHRFFFQLCHPRTGSRCGGQGQRTMVGKKKQCVKQQHKWKSTEVKAFDFRAVVMEALPRKGRLEAGGHFEIPQLCFLLRSECFRCFYRVLPSLPVKFQNAGVCHRRLGEFPDYVASPLIFD